MKIYRRGSSADHGESSVDLSSPSVEWSSSQNCALITHRRAKDFTSDAHHSYRLSLSVEEFRQVLEVFALAAQQNPECFERELSGSLSALLKLQFVAAGIRT
jgi:hypothetical protein